MSSMNIRAVCLRIAVCAALVPSTSLSAQNSRPRVKQVLNDTTLLLTNGQQWVPGIEDIKYFGVFPGSSFAMLGGMRSVADPFELYIWGVGDSLPKLVALYPGSMVDLDGNIYGYARVFVGSCLRADPAMVVVFWHSTKTGEPDSTFAYAPGADSTLFHERVPLTPEMQNAVQAAVNVGECRELPPL
jgi:hypothetical protein